MFVQKIEEINAVFNDEAILNLIQKALESDFYEIKYEKFELVNAEFTTTEEGKPVVKIKYQKIVRTVDKNEEKENDDNS